MGCLCDFPRIPYVTVHLDNGGSQIVVYFRQVEAKKLDASVYKWKFLKDFHCISNGTPLW